MTAPGVAAGPAEDRLAIGIDVGGTKVLAGLVRPDGTIERTERRPTPGQAGAVVDAIVDAARALGAPDGTPVGCGFPALVTLDGVARYGPNIAARELPLRERLAERLGAHVVVDNDASAAAWGEFVVGAGRGVEDSMVMYTLGTGVGGGLILGRRLHRGANGFAGELGHHVLRVDGEPGPSGVDGELEAYSSGTAIERLAAEAHAAGRLEGTALSGPTPPDGAALTDAALAGEPVAVEVLAAVGRDLGIAAAALVNALDPELIVVGGGAAAGGELILQPARAALRAHVLGPDHRPDVPIVPAELGPAAGLVGAALLALCPDASAAVGVGA